MPYVASLLGLVVNMLTKHHHMHQGTLNTPAQVMVELLLLARGWLKGDMTI